MDLNRLFGMLTRMFISSAVNAGIEHAASKGKSEAEMTPEERQQAREAKQTAKKAQKMLRLGRRFLR
ncbi:MAG: hypothetical protein MUE52_12345 [Tabrizicola sp.]|jgi:hypothetical protein|nr:hypothetical protein [Tabrizicola sp.]